MPPLIIIVRHGEAEHNIAAREKGDDAYLDPAWKDARLSKLGHEQAESAGIAISEQVSDKITAIWCSPLTRCIQTAEHIARHVEAASFFVHDNLLERLGGGHVCNERRSRDEIVAEYPDINVTLLPDTPPTWSIREPLPSVRSRITSLCDHLQKSYRNVEVPIIMIVSHHDAIKELVGVSLGNAKFVVVDG